MIGHAKTWRMHAKGLANYVSACLRLDARQKQTGRLYVHFSFFFLSPSWSSFYLHFVYHSRQFQLQLRAIRIYAIHMQIAESTAWNYFLEKVVSIFDKIYRSNIIEIIDRILNPLVIWIFLILLCILVRYLKRKRLHTKFSSTCRFLYLTSHASI